MNRRTQFAARTLALATVAALTWANAARAADIEAFEFNDANGTLLANASNTGVGGIGVWAEDPGMAPSDIRDGVYNIVKSSSILESNYFQITNITSGTYYLTARMSGWNFQNFDSTNLEEFRIAFLDDDDANFGSTITAQATIRRETGGGVLIASDALGAGARNIPGTAALSTTQTQPFTAVVELNKTSNTYKVFYKDGTNPSQVLGIGAVSPVRGGNSVRMAVNNSFGDFSIDYPLEYLEVFSVDRIAVSDTNPLADLITLEIDRSTGAITLRNTSGASLTGLESYSIASTTGPFDPTKWQTIAGHYDSAGDSSVDNAPWVVTTSSKTELGEMFQSGDGGGLANGQSVALSVAAGGTWLKSPLEDVHMSLNFAGGVTRTVNVNFVGNGGVKWAPGDLNFDTVLNANDWTTFIANAETNLSGLSIVEAYQRGDLNSDGFNNLADFIQFKTLFNAANGVGAFEAMLAGIPEPSGVVLLGTAVVVAACGGRRRGTRMDLAQELDSTAGDGNMRRVVRFLQAVVVVVAIGAGSIASHGAILEDFPFSDANDTPLESAANNANPTNSWIISGAAFDPSAVLNGSFRISKSSTNLATAHLDIANVTSGKAWLVADIAGWNFTSTASAPSEEVRFAFLDNDNMPPSGSTITAQMDIRRSGSALALVGMGALGTGATNVAGSYALPLVRSTPFSMVLELDKNLDQYSVYYNDNTASYQLLGTANLGASTLNPGDRDGNSIRFAPTGAFNDMGEFFDVDRIYLTNTSPIGGPVVPVALKLEVKSNGEVVIRNTTSSVIDFDSYRITSATSALNFAGWNSLSDKLPLLNPVDGTDPGTTAGDGIGETWDESGGSNDGVLSESFLLGSTTLAASDMLSLGNAFKTSGAHDLTFEYHDVDTGAIVVGAVDYVTVAGIAGDYNANGTVDAADYILWRKHLNTSTTLPNDTTPGTDATDYGVWRANFGKSTGSGTGAAISTAVPECSSLLLLMAGVLSLIVSRRLL